MSDGTLYVKRVETPAGNVGHEVVSMVSAEAVARARQNVEDARQRLRAVADGQDPYRLTREAQDAKRAVSRAVFDMAESWMKDNARAGRASW